MAVTCPYCLETLTPKKILRVCNTCGDIYAPKGWGWMRQNSKMVHENCQGQYSVLRCPNCGSELPSNIEQCDWNLSLALVGSFAAGKSCFATTMIEELKKNKSFILQIIASTEETRKQQSENAGYLFDRLCPVPATYVGSVLPQQWHLTLKSGSSKALKCNLSIYDGASEDQELLDPLTCRYLARSEAIILFVDPCQFSGIRNTMLPGEIKNASCTTLYDEAYAYEFINGIIRFLEESDTKRSHGKMNVPLAVILCKMDAIADRFNKSAQVTCDSKQAELGCYIKSEANCIHEEIKHFLQTSGESLTELLDAHFNTWHYFGASSFGTLPVEVCKLENPPKPLRVLDPLIWLLSLRKMIPTQK